MRLRLSSLLRHRRNRKRAPTHLAALIPRPSVYAAKGYGSLFAYCTEALLLSEDAACNRIAAAKTCRRFPAILESLASGGIPLTSIRILHPHLTAENCEAVLAKASGRSRREIEALVAELAPRPDAATSVRKLPAPTVTPLSPIPVTTAAEPPGALPRPVHHGQGGPREFPAAADFAPARDPDGDAGVIVERALALLLLKVESAKVGATKDPRAIRPGTDGTPSVSRHVATHDKRTAWNRDDAQRAFVSREGHRCTERAFLEFHHVHAYALGGPSTADNISLRCRRHNQYEAELAFGPRPAPPTIGSGSAPRLSCGGAGDPSAPRAAHMTTAPTAAAIRSLQP
jgi:hypothetical protein